MTPKAALTPPFYQLISTTDEFPDFYLRAVPTADAPLPPAYRKTHQLVTVLDGPGALEALLTGPELAMLYRVGFGADAPKKFSDRATGAERVWREREAIAAKCPVPTGRAPRAAAPTTRAAGPRRGRPATFADTAVITQVTTNPKRAGSAAHARYSLYRPGMTVGQYVAAGGRIGDLRWDTKMKFIRVAASA